MALTKISTDGVKDDAVTAGKIPANAVGSSELADNAVDSAAIAANAVTDGKIQNNAVTTNTITNNAVVAAKIAEGSVTTAKIADQAVDLTKLPHGTSSTDGKFLRANNGADPSFETVNTDLVADTSPQLGGDLQSNGNDIDFADNDKAVFGTGGDLEIFHDSSNSYIKDTGTGSLLIRGSAVSIQSTAGEAMIEGVADGAVTLKYDNSTKLETTSGGVSVNGNVILGDAEELQMGNSTDFQIFHGGTNSHIVNSTNELKIRSNDVRLQNAAGNENYFVGFANSYSAMYFNNNKSLETTADGGVKAQGNYIVGTSGRGIQFNASDSGSSELLDDYEEGTYNPFLGALGNFGGSGLSLTYTTQTGYYVKIGSFVFCNGILAWNAKAGTLSNTSTLVTLSIPFAMGSGSNQGAGQLSYNDALDFNADCNSVHGVGSNAFVYFNRVATGSGKHLGYVYTQNVSSNGQINFAYSYRII